MSSSTETVCSNDAEPAIGVAGDLALQAESSDTSREATSGRNAYFDSEHLTKDLGRRTVRGGAITLTAQGAKFALRLGSTAILARLLTPADFGLIAMVTVVTGFVEMFKDAGLSMATIQREKITHAQVSTLFWINVALSLLVMLAIAASAPLLAWLYAEPRLLWVTLALSGTMVFGGLAVQHQALLRRNMQFGRLAVIEIVSMAAGIAVAIAMAWQGYSYWALVGMTAGTAVATATVSFAMSGWVPGLPVRGCGAKEMLKFGAGVSGFSFVSYFSRNSDNVIVGTWWGTSALGVYSKAYGILLIPIAQLSRPLQSAMLPMLCRLQKDPQAFRNVFREMLKGIALITIPGMAALIIIADALVSVFLGDQWSQAVPVFRALGGAAMLQGVYNVTSLPILAIGNGRAYFRLSFLVAVPTLIAFVAAAPFGVVAIGGAYSIAIVAIVWPLKTWYVASCTPIEISDYYVAIAKPLCVATIVSVIMLLIRSNFEIESPLALISIAFLSSLVPIVMGAQCFRNLYRFRT